MNRYLVEYFSSEPHSAPFFIQNKYQLEENMQGLDFHKTHHKQQSSHKNQIDINLFKQEIMPVYVDICL